MKSLKTCRSIEEKIEYVKKTDPAELVGEIMGLEGIICTLEHMSRVIGDNSKKIEKENKKLKKEIKKLKSALDEEGIEPETEVLGKKMGDILTGKELRIAAEKKLKVRYVEKYYDFSISNRNYNKECIMEKADTEDAADGSYYIGDTDIFVDEWKDNEEVIGDFDEGVFEVRRAKGVKYE